MVRLLSLLTLLACVTQCGNGKKVPVCVMGIGDCSAMDQQLNSNDGNKPQKELFLTISEAEPQKKLYLPTAGDKSVNVYAQGGTPPYRFEDLSGKGKFETEKRTLKSLVSYTLPGAPGTYTIRVHDSKSQVVDYTFQACDATGCGD